MQEFSPTKSVYTDHPVLVGEVETPKSMKHKKLRIVALWMLTQPYGVT